MLTRRHIRVKVMQCIYALTQSKGDSLEKQEKFLAQSIQNTYTLYLLMLSLFRELHQMAEERKERSSKKYLKESGQAQPDPTPLLENRLLQSLSSNKQLSEALEKRKLKNWYYHEEYVRILFRAILESPIYQAYCGLEKRDYEADRQLLIDLFREVIAPNDKIYEYFEDDQLTWIDDLPLVNTFLLKQLKKVKEDHAESYFLPKLLKDQTDEEFAKKLLVKTLLNDAEWSKEIQGKTPNWDKDRIAQMDLVLLKMAIAELLSFPSIPERVTLNEYLEIAKEYSTPKSSIFINGILDKLVREYKENGKLNKMGRGLM